MGSSVVLASKMINYPGLGPYTPLTRDSGVTGERTAFVDGIESRFDPAAILHADLALEFVHL